MARKESTPEAFAARRETAVDRAFVCRVDSGEHWWCACGKSERQPLCDGSHRGGDVGPLILTLDESRDVAWCGCKRTATPPYCDGRHACVGFEARA